MRKGNTQIFPGGFVLFKNIVKSEEVEIKFALVTLTHLYRTRIYVN